MSDIPPIHKYLINYDFRTAVGLIDDGSVQDLEYLLIANPDLTNMEGKFYKKFFASGTKPKQYFSKPKLLRVYGRKPSGF